MTIALIILGFVLLNVVLAYVPIMLVVGYNLRPKKPKDDLLHRYLSDEVSTDEYVEEIEKRYRDVKHIPFD